MDKREGIGYELFDDGNIYHGTYKQGRPHGKGTYT
jgi:hypothetical protein